jgi:Protein of unknown function (DUF2934)
MDNGYGTAAVKEAPRQGDPLEQQVAEQAPQEAEARRPGMNDASAPTDEAIAIRAYELYCARGYVDGNDLDDWLEAERSLRAEPRD